MSYFDLCAALLTNKPYFGSALRSLQGFPARHKYFRPTVESVAKDAQQDLNILEIGTWVGASTLSWLQALKDLGVEGKITCVDIWEPYFDTTDNADVHYEEMNEFSEKDLSYALFRHNIKSANFEHQVIVKKGASKDILPTLADRSFDIIYIDGSHILDDVLTDLQEAKRLVKLGGIICGDDLELQLNEVDKANHRRGLEGGVDYMPSWQDGPEYHPGVTEAVWQVFGEVGNWEGFWAIANTDGGWQPPVLDMDGAQIPPHILEAVENDLTEVVASTDAYNIIKMGDRYFAVAKMLGPVQLLSERLGDRDLGIFIKIRNSLEKLEDSITNVPHLKFLENYMLTPRTLGQYAGFNIIQYRTEYIGVAQSLGKLDLREDPYVAQAEHGPEKIIISDSEDGVRARIDLMKLRQNYKEDNFSGIADQPINQNQERISIIVPTRKRPDGLMQLLRSLKQTASVIGRLEIVLVIDEDDESYEGLTFPDMEIKQVTAKPGIPMGVLNMLGYKASSGDYIMLLNDDVVVMTKHWDDRVLEVFHSFADQIVLVHTDDGIFGDKLCTFPFVSRQFCLLIGGICPVNYDRYRIDDHIYNIFNLLSVLGHDRIVYLPDVLFEHHNFNIKKDGTLEYQPDPEIHGKDTVLFDELLEDRKQTSALLAQVIQNHLNTELKELRSEKLKDIHDSVSLRKPEFVRYSDPERKLSTRDSRTTIGVVTANIFAPHAQKCLEAIKDHTENYDLIVLDNNRSPGFNHPREMNNIIASCTTDFLVLMDDDVIVNSGWLDGLLGCVTPRVGVVAPLHTNEQGDVTFAGVAMRPDRSGHHSHAFNIHEKPFPVQTICSAILLIDINKCGHIRFNEAYSKYFFDLIYGLRVWEEGYKVILAPDVSVIHIGGATLKQGSELSNQLFEEQRQKFQKEWFDAGRYENLENYYEWKEAPEINKIISLPERVYALLEKPRQESDEKYVSLCRALFEELKFYPAIEQYVHGRLFEKFEGIDPVVDGSPNGHLAYLRGMIGPPVRVEADIPDMSVFFIHGRYYAVPDTEKDFALSRISGGQVGSWCAADSLESVSQRARSGDFDHVLQADTAHYSSKPFIVQEGFSGFNIIKHGMYYGILQSEGAFDMGRVKGLEYEILFTGRTLDEVRRKISALSSFNIFYAKVKIKIRNLFALKAAREKPRAASGTARSKRNLSEKARPATGAEHSAAHENSPVFREIERAYRGKDIWLYGYTYFAVEQGQSIDVATLKNDIDGNRFAGHSIQEVKQLVDDSLSASNDSPGTVIALSWRDDQADRELIASAFPNDAITYLVPGAECDRQDSIAIGATSLFDFASQIISGDRKLPVLPDGPVKCVVVPWTGEGVWRNNSLETLAARISEHVVILGLNGKRLNFFGERLNRLVYNKAYLSSMFDCLPKPNGMRVLEIGCSDGLVCELVATFDPAEIVGIDQTPSIHGADTDANIKYLKMDAGQLDFEDNSFDVVYSIATLEHVSNPYQSILEAMRVLKPGGYAYFQAGPLYHTPFGHHMFGHFDDYPWIHLRKERNDIIIHAHKRDLGRVMRDNFDCSVEDYVDGMLSDEHVNGLFLEEYRLEEIMKLGNIEVLDYRPSFEGKELLSEEILDELSDYSEEQLTGHGFELFLRKKFLRKNFLSL